MKKNSKPELALSWWNSNKPKAWDDGRLEMALSAYVKGLAALEREKSPKAFEAANDLLDQLEKQAAASEKIAAEKPRKEPKDYDAEDFKNTAEVLKKFGDCVKSERQRLEGLVEEDDEAAQGMLADEDAYKKYLKKAMSKVQGAEYFFALALAKPSTPEKHRFLFHKSKDGKQLGKQILEGAEWLDTKKLTWGTASADPKVGSNLVLKLDHKQLGGLIKQGNQFLKTFKPLPFDTIVLVSAETGEVIQDLPEDPETDTEGTTTTPSSPDVKAKSDLLVRLEALAPRIKEFAAAADAAGLKAGADLEAKKAALAPRNRLLTLVRECKGMINKKDEQAEAMLADIERLLNGDQPKVEPKVSAPGPKETSPLLARLNGLTSRIKEFSAAADAAGLKAGGDLEAKKAALAPRNRLLTLVRDCKGMIGKNDEQAEAMLEDIELILKSAQGDVAPSTSGPTAAERWSAVRTDVESKIQAEIKEIVATKDPDANKAELELAALIRQLKAKVETQKQAAEMERYLIQSEVLAAFDTLAYPVKKSLLNVLKAIKPALPA